MLFNQLYSHNEFNCVHEMWLLKPYTTPDYWNFVVGILYMDYAEKRLLKPYSSKRTVHEMWLQKKDY